MYLTETVSVPLLCLRARVCYFKGLLPTELLVSFRLLASFVDYSQQAFLTRGTHARRPRSPITPSSNYELLSWPLPVDTFFVLLLMMSFQIRQSRIAWDSSLCVSCSRRISDK